MVHCVDPCLWRNTLGNKKQTAKTGCKKNYSPLSENANAQDDDGNTPIQQAANSQYNNTEIVKLQIHTVPCYGTRPVLWNTFNSLVLRDKSTF